jgi:hypothetical protein
MQQLLQTANDNHRQTNSMDRALEVYTDNDKVKLVNAV